MPRLESACPLDCPDLCSLTVEVTDDRVVRVEGSQRNPLTSGVICGKVRKIAAHVHGDERLRHPLIRTGDKKGGAAGFRQASWDEALELVATRMREAADRHGGESILPYNYGGSNGFLTQQSVDARLFRRMGASRIARTLCAAPSSAALQGLYGGMAGVALDDIAHARLIVLWGVNPSATGIHLVPVIEEARAAGARVVVCDPRRIPLAGAADLHIPLRPGTDLPVALAIIHWLFSHDRADSEFLSKYATGVDALRERASAWPIERAARVAGVPARDLEQFAELYAEASPAVIRCGWGQERNRNGGSATAAILALPAVAGKFGVLGGGYTQSNGSAWSLSREPAAAEPERETRLVNMIELGRALCDLDDPPIAVLFVYNCNPLVTAPEQNVVLRGLERPDLFTVVYDQVMTDTAEYADVVLPATTFLEHRELRRGYGANYVFDSRPVLAPVGESRPNYDVFAELCRRLGVARADDPVTTDAMVAAILDASDRSADIAGKILEQGMAERPGGAHPVAFVDAFPGTPDGKIQLFPDKLDHEALRGLYHYADDPGSERYPLALISPALSRMITSTFGQLLPGIVAVEIHPDDARARGIQSGDEVRIFNELGEVRTRARLSPSMRPGVLCLPKGLWRRHTHNRLTANALAPDHPADLGGGACYNDSRVDIALVSRQDAPEGSNAGASRRRNGAKDALP